MNARRPLLLLALVLVLQQAAPALAQSIPELHRDRILVLLRYPFPKTTEKQWRTIGPPESTSELLVETVMDRDLSEAYRVRAVRALQWFPTKRSQQFLWQVVYDRYLEEPLKRAALCALGAGFGAEVLPELSRALRDSSESLREGAAMGLGHVPDPRARSTLENRLFHEDSLDVRLAIERALRRVAKWEAEEEAKRNEMLFDGQPRPVRPSIGLPSGE